MRRSSEVPKNPRVSSRGRLNVAENKIGVARASALPQAERDDPREEGDQDGPVERMGRRPGLPGENVAARSHRARR